MSNCAVCVVPSAGTHLGVTCCRACAAFFRRTRQLNLQYKCRFEQNCDVTHKNRYSCRYCRLQKCVHVGMRTGDSPRSTSEDHTDTSDSSVNSPTSHSDRQEILYMKLDELFDKDQPSCSLSIPLTLHQQALLAFDEHTKKWPITNIFYNGEMSVLKHIDMLFVEMENVAQFCMSIKEFARLRKEQKWKFFKQFWKPFQYIERTLVTTQYLGFEDSTRFLFYDGNVVPVAQCGHHDIHEVTELKKDELERLMKTSMTAFQHYFFAPFLRFRVDKFETMYILLNVLFDTKRREHFDDEMCAIATRIKEQLIEELHNYYFYELKQPSYASRIYKIVRVIGGVERVCEIENEDEQLINTFDIFKEDILMRRFRL